MSSEFDYVIINQNFDVAVSRPGEHRASAAAAHWRAQLERHRDLINQFEVSDALTARSSWPASPSTIA